MKQKRKLKASHGWFWLLGSLVVKEKPQHSNSCSSARLNYMLIWPRLVLWGAPPHLRCPFSFLFLAGVLIGWLAAPFSFGIGAAAVGGDIGEKGSGSPSRLDLNGPAGENFKGLKEKKKNNGQVIINMRAGRINKLILDDLPKFARIHSSNSSQWEDLHSSELDCSSHTVRLLPCNLVISVSVALYFTFSHVSSQLPILARTTETFILKTLTFLV